MTPKFKVGDRVEWWTKWNGSRGTVIDILDESQPIDYIVLWDGFPNINFCHGRYLKLEAPPKREELVDYTGYDS